MNKTITIKSKNGKKVTVTEDAFLQSLYSYIKERFKTDHSQIFIEADGVEEFVIVPTNFKQHGAN